MATSSGNGADEGSLAVRTKGLKRYFQAGDQTVRAVDDVDFEVEPGAFVMVVGPSGCGKTTLLSLIAGVLDPDEGEVEVYGERWREMSRDEATRRRGFLIGFVFQSSNLVPSLTAIENACVPALIQGRPRKEAFDRAERALGDVGLGDRLGSRPSELSGGMNQRVAIARALVADASLLICDEPTASLDAKTGGEIMQRLRKVSEDEDGQGRRRAVIAVTHDQRMFRHADLIHRMDDGRMSETRRPDDSPPDDDRRNENEGRSDS